MVRSVPAGTATPRFVAAFLRTAQTLNMGSGRCEAGALATRSTALRRNIYWCPMRWRTLRQFLKRCLNGKERMRRLMDTIASGRFDTRPLVTHRFNRKQIEEAYDLFANQCDGVLKIAITV